MKHQRSMWGVLLAGLLLSPQAHAYSLFHPTPKDKLRPISVDQPNFTDAPQTVDAGHLQIEIGAFSYAVSGRSYKGISHSNNMTIASTTFRLGVLNFLDLEMTVEPYIRTQTEPAGGVQTTQQGFGDMYLLSKINFFGNDSGKWSMGFMPQIKVPTNQNGVGNKAYEGGGSVLLQYIISRQWSLGVESQFNMVQDQPQTGHSVQYNNSGLVNFNPTPSVRFYTEYYSSVTQESGVPLTSLLDFGFLYSITPNIVYDIALNIGLNRPSETINVLTGITTRF